MFRVFGFAKGSVCEPPSKYKPWEFWQEISSREEEVWDPRGVPNGLVVDHSYIIMYKLICHSIFGNMKGRIYCKIIEM